VGGVWGARSCVPCCDVCAVRSCRGRAGRPAGVWGLCVCILRASVRCALRGLYACAVSGVTRHDADVPLWWVGLVASCVSVRTCLWCDGTEGCGAGRHVRDVRLACCEESWLRHTCDVQRASWACIAGAASSAVSRVLYRSIAIADMCCRVCVAAPRLAAAAV
jgi:hypothetical protein